MAGDWIKMRGNLWSDPRISRLCDLTDQGEAAIIGGLYWLWATADQHSEDGIMAGLSLRSIDRNTGIKGFGEALCSIGWIADHPEGIRIVRFDEHNGSSAKKRCQTAKRVANFKAGNTEVTQGALPDEDDCVSGALPREREEKSKPSISEQTTSTTNTARSVANISPSPSQDDRCKTLADRLSKLEAERTHKPARCSSRDPRVQAWVTAGVTDPQFREAYELAVDERMASGDQAAVNPGFLDVFIAKVANPSDAPSSVSGVARAWHESKSGIDAKAVELGIPAYSIEAYPRGYPQFKAVVYEAAGLKEAA